MNRSNIFISNIFIIVVLFVFSLYGCISSDAIGAPDRENLIGAAGENEKTSIYQLAPPVQLRPPTNIAYDITIDDFCVKACNGDTIDEDNCVAGMDVWHNKNYTTNTQDITNDLVACFEMTVANYGPSPVSFKGSPLAMFFYVTPTEEYSAEDALLLGYYMFGGEVDGVNHPDTHGKTSVHFTTPNNITCLPYFYYDRFKYPNSNPNTDGFTVWVQIDPSTTQLPYDTDRSNHLIMANCKLVAENGGDDPLISNADHNDMVCIETHSPIQNNTDTILLLHDELIQWEDDAIRNMPIQNVTDFNEYNKYAAFYLASYLTPIFTDTGTKAPMETAKECKYLPAGEDDTEGTFDDKVYYIRIQLSPYHSAPLPDCYSIRVCDLTDCEWPKDDDMPCVTEPNPSATVLFDDALKLHSFPIEYTSACDSDPNCVVHTKFNDRTDFHWYRLVRP